MLTELEFKSLAGQGYNRIPLVAEAFADLETPLSLYLKLANLAIARARERELLHRWDPTLYPRPEGAPVAGQFRGIPVTSS